jgi:hypothetical protein
MALKKTVTLSFFPWTLCLLSFLFPISLASQDFQHGKVTIQGFDGSPLRINSKDPYSPKKTCGACHDYEQITRGYHFQQGRTDGTGKIVIRDSFDPKYPWNLSSGMFGKHSLASLDSSQLAKKVNPSPSNIDKSAFYFLQNCGVCHPGGGFGEYDRDGNLYFNEETKKLGYEPSDKSSSLDGDYTPFSMGDVRHGAPWNKSGLSEADCLLCHLKGYQWKERGAALRGRFFREGPSVGAGWAKLKLSQDQFENPKADEITIDYTQKDIADFENLHLLIVPRPSDENCWTCHADSDGRKSGRQWAPDADIHKARGLNCVTCHPGDKEHNFAKGNTLEQTVRDDLDNTMYSCEDCHYKGKNKKAPRYRHPFSPRHMKRIACQTCHIPYLTASADLVYDHASSGKTILYDTSKFLSNHPLDTKGSVPGRDPNIWYPALRELRGSIVPVKSLIVIYWGDLDENTKVVKPIPLWKIRGLKKPPLKDDNNDESPEINSPEEIKAFLKVLREKDPFGIPVANHPVLMKGGFLYHLDNKGEVEKIKHDQAQRVDYSLSHGIVSGPNVIGARGCKDCHSKNSPFFLRKILADPYDEKGKPVYTEAWEFLGINREKLDRLLVEQ